MLQRAPRVAVPDEDVVHLPVRCVHAGDIAEHRAERQHQLHLAGNLLPGCCRPELPRTRPGTGKLPPDGNAAVQRSL